MTLWDNAQGWHGIAAERTMAGICARTCLRAGKLDGERADSRGRREGRMGPWSGDGSALACEYALVADGGEREGIAIASVGDFVREWKELRSRGVE